MKIAALAFTVALAGAALAPPAALADSHRAPPLRGGQCLDPDYARGWVYLDDRNLLVDAGRYRYHIELNTLCSTLDWSPFIAFRGDSIGGRVCGNAFDAVLTRERPCTIARMEIISKDEYKALEQQHSRKGRRRVPRAYD